MRRPRHRKVRGGTDCHTFVFTAHGKTSKVTIDVSEFESGPRAGQLCVELRNIDGRVRLITPTNVLGTEIKANE